MPITVINGARDAPDAPGIAVFGGTHGNEYEGQIAVKRLCRDLDPETMGGRVILMPQLSESACRAHQRSSPEDNVNMNRAFPGVARGTLSYRIAHFVSSRVFPQARVVIDLHAGGREASFPLCTSLHPIPDRAQQAETLLVASLFDTPFIYMLLAADGVRPADRSGRGRRQESLSAPSSEWAKARAGAASRTRTKASRTCLRHYGMLPGAITRVDAARPGPPRLVQAPDLRDYVPCPFDGIWEPAVDVGGDVAEGELLGRLHDFADHASAPTEITAHRAGVVVAMHFGAVCRRGATLYVIARDVPVEP